MKNIIILVLFLFLASCNKNKIDKHINQEEVITMNQITTDYDTLIKRVKYDGNIEAYDELFFSFMDANKSERTDSLMIYSKIMAEKYNYKKAYFDYFIALCEKNNIHIDFGNYSSINIIPMNKSSKKQAENWLKKMLNNKIITQKEYDLIIKL